jgi:hypothetical protein
MGRASAGTRRFLDVECAAYEGREASEKSTLLGEMDRRKVGCWIVDEFGSVAGR